jgi:hypothetical protein
VVTGYRSGLMDSTIITAAELRAGDVILWGRFAQRVERVARQKGLPFRPGEPWYSILLAPPDTSPMPAVWGFPAEAVAGPAFVVVKLASVGPCGCPAGAPAVCLDRRGRLVCSLCFIYEGVSPRAPIGQMPTPPGA